MSKKILIVDDDPSIAQALQATFEDEGYEVETDGTGRKLITMSGDYPNLILLDIMLPGFNGCNLARRLKSQPNTRRIPIIMISAHADAAEDVKETGAEEFMSKPFDVDELIGVAEKYAAHSH